MKKSAKTILVLLLVSLVMTSLVGCGSKPSTDSAASDEKIVMRFGNTIADLELHPSGCTQLWFIEEVTKRLGEDRIEIVSYPNAQLGSTAEQVLGGLLNRNSEIMDFSANNYADYTAAFIPVDAPYLFESSEIAFETLDGPAGQLMKDKAREAGLHILYYVDNGFRHIANSRHPITQVADMKGFKIRTPPNPVYLSLMEALGAAGTPMAITELYTSLQQGVVDGFENSIVAMHELKLYEQTRYLTYTNHTYSLSTAVMSAEYYDSLPDDVKKVLDEVAMEAQIKSREFEKQFEDTAMNEMSDLMEAIELSPEAFAEFVEAGRSVWPSIAESAGEEYFNEIVSYVVH